MIDSAELFQESICIWNQINPQHDKEINDSPSVGYSSFSFLRNKTGFIRDEKIVTNSKAGVSDREQETWRKRLALLTHLT